MCGQLPLLEMRRSSALICFDAGRTVDVLRSPSDRSFSESVDRTDSNGWREGQDPSVKGQGCGKDSRYLLSPRIDGAFFCEA